MKEFSIALNILTIPLIIYFANISNENIQISRECREAQYSSKIRADKYEKEIQFLQLQLKIYKE